MPDQSYKPMMQRYQELIAISDQYAAAEIFVSPYDFECLAKCTPHHVQGMDAKGRYVQANGVMWRPKPLKAPREGTLDLTGDTPRWVEEG